MVGLGIEATRVKLGACLNPVAKAVAGIAVLIAVAACGSTSKATAPTTTAPTLDPASQTNLDCQQALDPWTQWLANTQFADSLQWISAVGQQSPLINIPEDGARVFIQETVQVGVTQATSDAYAKVRDECNTFAQAHPGYDFSTVPAAPTSG